jgi:hypothetical protein
VAMRSRLTPMTVRASLRVEVTISRSAAGACLMPRKVARPARAPAAAQVLGVPECSWSPFLAVVAVVGVRQSDQAQHPVITHGLDVPAWYGSSLASAGIARQALDA